MVKGSNRKKRSGEWSKYTLDQGCVHDWRSGSLAEGWQKCAYCDAVRRFVPVKSDQASGFAG